MTWRARWQTLAPREQRSVALLASVLGLVAVWFIAVAPALNALQESSQRRAQLTQQHAHLLSLQAKAQSLQKQTPLSREEALRRLQGITAVPGMQLHVQGERVSVQLKAVSAPALAQWLTQARTQAQALPLEAHLTRSASPSASAGASNNSNALAASTVAWDGHLVMRLPPRNTMP
jgi:general secretion pathway protein M